jgi:hypothetical protein
VGTEEQPVMYTLEQLIGSRRGTAGDPSSPLALSLAQLAYVAGVPLAAGGTLVCVALVAVDETVDGFDVRPLGAADAERQLDANRFGVSTEPRPATVFEGVLGHELPPRPAPDLLASLAAEVRCCEVRVGPGFVRDASGPRQLLDELVGG